MEQEPTMIEEILHSLTGAGPYAIMLALTLLVLFRATKHLMNWGQPLVQQVVTAHVALVEALERSDEEKTDTLRHQHTVLEQLERTANMQTEILKSNSVILKSIDDKLNISLNQKKPN